MTLWTTGFLQSNGIRVHYTRTGGNKPALVALHGFSDDGPCWTPIAQALEADFDVVMLDARGHGRSDGPPTGYSYDDYAADTAGAIAALKLEWPIVMGHSMGAVTALTLAALYPSLPNSIILEDPPPFWMPPPVSGTENDGADGMRNWIVNLKRETREEMISGCRRNSPTWPESELGPWADSKLRMSFNVLSILSADSHVPLRERISAITCPALLIIADTTLGAITSREQAHDLKTLVPQLKIKQIDNAGHSIRREQPARYLEIVRPFALSNQASYQ